MSDAKRRRRNYAEYLTSALCEAEVSPSGCVAVGPEGDVYELVDASAEPLPDALWDALRTAETTPDAAATGSGALVARAARERDAVAGPAAASRAAPSAGALAVVSALSCGRYSSLLAHPAVAAARGHASARGGVAIVVVLLPEQPTDAPLALQVPVLTGAHGADGAAAAARPPGSGARTRTAALAAVARVAAGRLVAAGVPAEAVAAVPAPPLLACGTVFVEVDAFSTCAPAVDAALRDALSAVATEGPRSGAAAPPRIVHVEALSGISLRAALQGTAAFKWHEHVAGGGLAAPSAAIGGRGAAAAGSGGGDGDSASLSPAGLHADAFSAFCALRRRLGASTRATGGTAGAAGVCCTDCRDDGQWATDGASSTGVDAYVAAATSAALAATAAGAASDAAAAPAATAAPALTCAADDAEDADAAALDCLRCIAAPAIARGDARALLLAGIAALRGDAAVREGGDDDVCGGGGGRGGAPAPPTIAAMFAGTTADAAWNAAHAALTGAAPLRPARALRLLPAFAARVAEWTAPTLSPAAALRLLANLLAAGCGTAFLAHGEALLAGVLAPALLRSP